MSYRRRVRAFRSLATALILAVLAAAIVAALQSGHATSQHAHRTPARTEKAS